MHLFLAHRKTRPTGRVLAEALGIDFGVQIRGNPETLIRWGNAGEYEWDRVNHVVNKASAISLAGDKLRTLTILKDAGISVPSFRVDRPDADSGTWYGRARRGFGGKDIIIQPRGQQTFGFGEKDFYTEHIPNDREYRLHVVGDEVVRLQRKYLERPDSDHHGGMVKNHKNGYVFKSPQKNLRPDRTDTAVAAVKALGLDFGAVDAVIAHDDTLYVLEVNTAPACSPLTAQAYIQALRRYLE